MPNTDTFPSQAGNPSPFTGAAFSTALSGLNWALKNAPRLLTIDGSSTANVLVATCEVDGMSSYSAGQRFKLYPAEANTGAMTININSIGVVAIRDAAGDALTGGEMTVGLHTELDFDGTVMRLVSQASGTGAGAINIQEFTGNGTWTRPEGVFQMARILAIGGGGSGAKSVLATSQHRVRYGGSGGSAAIITVPFASLAATESVQIGSGGGQATLEQAGLAGGDTSFGSLVTARGGLGGVLRKGSQPPTYERTEGQAVALGTGVFPDFAEPGGVSAFATNDPTQANTQFHAPNTLLAGPGGGTIYSLELSGGLAAAGIGAINGWGARGGTMDGVDVAGATALDAVGYGAGGGGVALDPQSMNVGTDGYCLVWCY